MYLPVSVGLLAIGIASLLFRFVAERCVVLVRRRTPKPEVTPAISVLKPLKGADEHLYENLASFARQDYPSFEIVLGCEDSVDPALAIARQVQRDYPAVPMTIVAGGRPIGYNPKINNLAQLARAARHDWVLVSDADVRADTGYLRAVAAETADRRVGLVSNVIASVNETSLGATLDSLHMNGFVASTICAADVLAAHPCVIGKSMFFRQSDLRRLGGLGIVKDLLAEDYVLGRAFRDAGFRVALSGHAISSVAGSRSVRSFFERHLRWSQMRRRISPWYYLGEPLLLPTPWLLASAVVALMNRAEGNAGLVAIAALSALTVRSLTEALFAWRLAAETFEATVVPLVPIKDAIVLAAWAFGWFKSTTVWRGNEFRIGRGSVLTPLAHDGVDAEGRSAWGALTR